MDAMGRQGSRDPDPILLADRPNRGDPVSSHDARGSSVHGTYWCRCSDSLEGRAFDGPRPLDLVITEGELDALSLLEAGYESVALGGATPSGVMLEWLVDAVEHANTIALWTDADPAGEGAVDRLARLLTKQYGWAWVESHVVRWRSATDANDMAVSGELQ